MPPGVTDYIDADLREPGKILSAAARTLDFTQPVAIMILGVLIFILDTGQAGAIVNQLLDAVPAGSYLAIAHTTNVVRGELTDEAVRHWNQFGEPKMTLRSPQEITRFFDRLELVEPGVVSCTRWRPESTPFGELAEVDEFCAVGRKPQQLAEHLTARPGGAPRAAHRDGAPVGAPLAKAAWLSGAAPARLNAPRRPETPPRRAGLAERRAPA